MWARVIEGMLGCWLAMSPFIFQHGTGQTWRWVVDLTGAGLAMLLACLAFWHPTRHAHWVMIGLGAALAGFGYFGEGYPTPPALQNDLIVGLLLVMLGVIPNHASQPSPRWRHLLKDPACED